MNGHVRLAGAFLPLREEKELELRPKYGCWYLLEKLF